MPRYHLHLRHGKQCIPDIEGALFETVADAHGEAIQRAREIMAERVRNGRRADDAV